MAFKAPAQGSLKWFIVCRVCIRFFICRLRTYTGIVGCSTKAFIAVLLFPKTRSSTAIHETSPPKKKMGDPMQSGTRMSQGFVGGLRKLRGILQSFVRTIDVGYVSKEG